MRLVSYLKRKLSAYPYPEICDTNLQLHMHYSDYYYYYYYYYYYHHHHHHYYY